MLLPAGKRIEHALGTVFVVLLTDFVQKHEALIETANGILSKVHKEIVGIASGSQPR